MKELSFEQISGLIHGAALKGLEQQVENLTVIDGFSFVPHDEVCFVHDKVHPNDIAFQFFADNLIQQLEKILI